MGIFTFDGLTHVIQVILTDNTSLDLYLGAPRPHMEKSIDPGSGSQTLCSHYPCVHGNRHSGHCGVGFRLLPAGGPQ